jgi:hypothetical protein
MARIINVIVTSRPGGGCNVSSEDLPGLILGGRDRTRILAAIEPAARALLERKGEDVHNIRIDATFEGA